MENETGMKMFEEPKPQPQAIIETASEAAAAGARAEIEAGYVIAYRNPRNMDEVRVKLLKECKRPGFAREAEYSKPVGGRRITGLSIRAAEAALRTMGNVRTSVATIFENDTQMKIRISVTDLETNATFSGEATVQKTVERRNPKDEAEIIGQRTNSTGQTVYIVKATDDDLQNKKNALISKELRNQALRILPADIREEMSVECRKTKANSAAKDPDSEKKAVMDAFASIGIQPIEIVEWLKHGLDAVQPAEIVELREMYQTIRDGESTWQAYQDAKKEEDADKDSTKPVARSKKKAKPEAPAEDRQEPDGATPSLQIQIQINWQERELPSGKLLSLLRKDGILNQFDGIEKLTDAQADVVMKNIGQYAERAVKPAE